MIVTFAARPKFFAFKEEGRVICLIDGHKLKVADPREVTDDGIITLVNEEQPRKAPLSIFLTDDGNEIWLNEEQPLKAEEPISTIEGGMTTFLKDEQSSKTDHSISRNESGKSIEVNAVHFWKHEEPIDVRELWKITCINEEHS